MTGANWADEFPFPDELWFIVTKPLPDDPDELCEEVLTGFFEEDGTGVATRIVYAFGDEDLANRHVERAGSGAVDQPYTPGSAADTVAFLERLLAHGHNFVGIDIEPNSGVCGPIVDLVGHFRRQQGP